MADDVDGVVRLVHEVLNRAAEDDAAPNLASLYVEVIKKHAEETNKGSEVTEGREFQLKLEADKEMLQTREKQRMVDRPIAENVERTTPRKFRSSAHQELAEEMAAEAATHITALEEVVTRERQAREHYEKEQKDKWESARIALAVAIDDCKIQDQAKFAKLKEKVQSYREPITRKVPQHHANRALYVSHDERDDIPCYPSIQAAVDAAVAGDSIYVLPGRYECSVMIDKNLEIHGVPDGEGHEAILYTKSSVMFRMMAAHCQIKKCVLRHEATAFTCIHVPRGETIVEGCTVSSRGGSGLVVDGINSSLWVIDSKIHNCRDYGIRASGPVRLTVDGCDISGNQEHGIGCTNKAEASICGSKIHAGNAGGISFEGHDTKGTVRHNHIEENAGPGIVVSNWANPHISENRIVDGKGFGLLLTECAGSVDQNSICRNRDHGIMADRASTQIIDNEVSDNKGCGVVIDNGCDLLLEGNTLANNFQSNVLVTGASRPRIIKNVLEGGTPSMMLSGESCPVVSYNTIRKSKGYGIEILKQSDPQCLSNHMTECVRGAVFVACDGKGLLSDNEIFSNGDQGVMLSGCHHAKITRNRIADEKFGIVLNQGATCVIDENLIERAIKAGILVTERSNPMVNNNTIEDGKSLGLLLTNHAKGNYVANDICNTRDTGIYILGNSHPVLTGNKVRNGRKIGIHVMEESKVVMHANHIVANGQAGVLLEGLAGLESTSNHYYDGGASGLEITGGAQVTLHMDSMYQNTTSGCAISDPGTNADIKECQMYSNRASGIVVWRKARASIEGCDIYQNDLAQITVREEGDPLVQHNKLHHGANTGVAVYSNGFGRFYNNEIYSNKGPGIRVSSKSTPEFKKNDIHNGLDSGIYVFENGMGLYDDNQISQNAGDGVYVRSNGNPTVVNNQIKAGQRRGIHVAEKGLGVYERNHVVAHVKEGIHVGKNANPRVFHNHIYDGLAEGIVVSAGGHGSIEYNQVYNNTIEVRVDGKVACAVLKHNQIYSGKSDGIYVTNLAEPVLQSNKISKMTGVGISIDNKANPTVTDNEVEQNQAGGLKFCFEGCGTVEKNNIHSNQLFGLSADNGSSPELLSNKVHANQGPGMTIKGGAKPRIQNNELWGDVGEIKVSDPGTETILKKNRLHSSNENAIRVTNKAKIFVEECQINDCIMEGIRVEKAAYAKVVDSTIKGCKHDGIICDQAEVHIQECVIEACAKVGIRLSFGSHGLITKNRIVDGRTRGILITQHSGATVNENVIQDNANLGIEVSIQSDPIIESNTIRRNGNIGVLIFEAARPKLISNDISAHQMSNVEVRNPRTRPVIRGNYIHGGKGAGLTFIDKAAGATVDNDISDNMGPGIKFEEGADPIVRGNCIHHNEEHGCKVVGADGTMMDNFFFHNSLGHVNLEGEGTGKVQNNVLLVNDDDFHDRGINASSSSSAEIDGNHVIADESDFLKRLNRHMVNGLPSSAEPIAPAKNKPIDDGPKGRGSRAPEKPQAPSSGRGRGRATGPVGRGGRGRAGRAGGGSRGAATAASKTPTKPAAAKEAAAPRPPATAAAKP